MSTENTKLELQKQGFNVVRDSLDTWNIVLCETLGDRNHSVRPELMGWEIGTGFKDEAEGVNFALSNRWQLCSRREHLEELYREFDSAWCRIQQVETAWRAVGTTCADNRVFTTRADLLENTQEFVRDEKARLVQKRLADSGVPHEWRGLVPSESVEQVTAFVRKFMEQPNQGWLVLCGSEAKSILYAAFVAASAEGSTGARYVSLWEAIQNPDCYSDVLSEAKFVALDMTTLIPPGTGAELGERLVFLMQRASEAVFGMRFAQCTTVVVSDFNSETTKRLLGKRFLTWLSNQLRFIDADGLSE